MRAARSTAAGASSSLAPVRTSENATEGLASAAFVTAAAARAPSASGEARNLRRAGVCAKSPSTRTSVAARPGGRLLGRRAAVLDTEPDGLRRGAVGGRQRQPRDRRDRRQRLAAEAEGRDAARGRRPTRSWTSRGARSASRASSGSMPLPSSTTRTSATPAASISTSMRARARVQRVLDQLLDDRGGPLDHLAGGDLVDHLPRDGGSWALSQLPPRAQPSKRRPLRSTTTRH